MQTYIVRVYRACAEDEGSVSGMVEDIESGQMQFFNSLIKLQSMVADSIGKGQIEFHDLTMHESYPLDNVA